MDKVWGTSGCAELGSLKSELIINDLRPNLTGTLVYAHQHFGQEQWTMAKVMDS